MQRREIVNCREDEDVPEAEPLSRRSDRRRRSNRSARSRIPGIRQRRTLCGRTRGPLSTTFNARFIFDSWLVRLSSGFRSLSLGPRRLVYWAGDYQIDLLLEPRPDTDELSLTGQVLDTTGGGGKPAKATIALLTGDIQVETQVNDLGEFHLDGRVDLGSKLRIKLPRMKVVSIPLDGVGSRVRPGGEARGI